MALICSYMVLVSLTTYYLITRAITAPVSVCHQQNASIILYVIIRIDTFVGKFHKDTLVLTQCSIISISIYNYIIISVQDDAFVTQRSVPYC